MRFHALINIFYMLAAAIATETYPAQYSYGFVEPEAPLINTDYTANFMQHKYDVHVTNIVAGQIYQSLANSKVRVDYTYEGVIARSIFDFKNTTSDGLVANYISSFNGSLAKQPQCDTYYISMPGFPLFTSGILRDGGSVFMGIVNDQIYGRVSAWQIMYGGVVPATIYLDQNSTFVRYDFTTPGDLRTFTTTRFFNIHFTNISADAFDSTCH